MIQEKSSVRNVILERMESLFAQGHNCRQCKGYCCTSQFNSMQVTPVEAYDLYEYLKNENRLTDKLIEELKECVKKYRLDQLLSTGKGTYFRRTYTCPFFKPQAKGCSISPTAKPYGCLAFNPLKRGVSEPGHCSSDQTLLAQVDPLQEENSRLKDELGLDWDKESIPVALLDLITLLGD